MYTEYCPRNPIHGIQYTESRTRNPVHGIHYTESRTRKLVHGIQYTKFAVHRLQFALMCIHIRIFDLVHVKQYIDFYYNWFMLVGMEGLVWYLPCVQNLKYLDILAEKFKSYKRSINIYSSGLNHENWRIKIRFIEYLVDIVG